MSKEPPPHLIKLGTVLREKRVSLGLSQEALAAGSSIHRTYIGGVERGERNPTVSTLLAITGPLQCSLSDVFSEASL